MSGKYHNNANCQIYYWGENFVFMIFLIIYLRIGAATGWACTDHFAPMNPMLNKNATDYGGIFI